MTSTLRLSRARHSDDLNVVAKILEVVTTAIRDSTEVNEKGKEGRKDVGEVRVEDG